MSGLPESQPENAPHPGLELDSARSLPQTQSNDAVPTGTARTDVLNHLGGQLAVIGALQAQMEASQTETRLLQEDFRQQSVNMMATRLNQTQALTESWTAQLDEQDKALATLTTQVESISRTMQLLIAALMPPGGGVHNPPPQ